MNHNDFSGLIQTSENYINENTSVLFQICLEELNLKLDKGDLIELLRIEFVPIYLQLVEIFQGKKDTVVLGIAGVNGSGKTTLARFLSLLLQKDGYYTINFSMDDLYPTKEERLDLANNIDPSLETRLMYDNMLVKRIFESLHIWEGPISIPKFDKSIDDRSPENKWQTVGKKPDFVIIEGVFTFAQPTSAENLSKIDLYINSKVDELSDLYNFMDFKIALLAESVENVIQFRKQQEIELRKEKGNNFGMTPQEVEKFILYFQTYLQRYTWPLENNPIIDFVYIFNSKRKITKISSPKFKFIY
jgi:D-glycerate 3-kinase